MTIDITKKEFLTAKELKELYGFGLDNQAKMRMDRKIPYIKIGNYIRYSHQQIKDWMLKNGVKISA